MAKAKHGIVTVWVKVTYDAIHIKPGSEAYPEQKTLRECLEHELAYANGDAGQGDYLDVLMEMPGSNTTVTKLILKRPGKKSITVRDTGTDTADITSENEESLLRFLELPDHKHEIQLSTKELKLHASKVKKIKGIDGIVIGLQCGPGKPTCMYFPWESSDTTYCGPSVDFFMKKMKEVGGGLKSEHEYTVTRKMAFKGWSECRICQQRNGSEEYLLSTGMLVPVGAWHYKTEHRLPLNLWSIPINNSVSLYYIAKHPI